MVVVWIGSDVDFEDNCDVVLVDPLVGYFLRHRSHLLPDGRESFVSYYDEADLQYSNC